MAADPLDTGLRAAESGGAEFRGTGRFRVVRRLGAGAMGVVYEATDLRDPQRPRRVALKSIRERDADLIYRLKREFRTLADLSHRNLIQLFDLVIEGDLCFLTMELIRGTDFVAHCRLAQSDPSVNADPCPSEADVLARDARPLAGACSVPRLRAALPQLFEGLCALHAAGKIHRDIKPSNVLVADDGRVVLLDFGLASEQGGGALESIRESAAGLTGTVEYVAPELTTGAEPTPACDLYGAGVLLFEALTGRLPFTGSLLSILLAKSQGDAPSPKSVAPDVPDDLDALCSLLLSRDPASRPSAEAALLALESGSLTDSTTGISFPSLPTESASPDAGTASLASTFAGRESEMAALLGQFDALVSGRASAALVLGPSGIGKSTLVREFLARLREPSSRGSPRDDAGPAVVLEGRCYEKELVPFRAMDGLIDHLAHHWRSLSAADATALLPREASALPRLFPVLGRVPCVADAPRGRDALDPKEIRTRAVTALRETLTRLADRHPLVLVLDDLQWVDPGTVAVLSDLMRPPDPPRALLVLSSRDEAAPVLLRLAADMGIDRRRVDVGALASAESERLARSLLGDAPPAVAERVAREAEGNPYFLGELARHVRAALAAGTGAAAESVRLDDVLGERVARLSPSARRLIEVVAVAGEPLDPPIAGHAALLDADALAREVGALRAGRMLRAAVGGGDALLEPYHDRIKQSVLTRVDDSRRRAIHGSIASAIEAASIGATAGLSESASSAEQLARHWAGAGEREKAAGYATTAADQSFATHHFDHAADLYRAALDLMPVPEGVAAAEIVKRRATRLRLAAALENAGRSAEAGDAYLAAAEGAEPAQALESRRKAAEQFLVSGHVDQGIATLKQVLEAVGERLPRTPRRALAAVVLARLRLRLRGLKWTPREAAAVPASDLARLDATMAAALGLGLVDNVRGAVFQTKGLIRALDAGEPRRVGRSLAYEAIFRASQSMKGREEARPLIAEARAVASERKDPYLWAWVGLAEPFASYSGGEFPAAAEGLAATEALLRAETTGTTWELNNARIFLLQTLRYAGEWARLRPLFFNWLHDARRRGDRFAETTLVRSLSGVWLADDDPAAARKAIEDAVWVLPSGSFHIQHWYDLRARAELALYEGSPTDALLPAFDALEKSMLLRVLTIRAESLWLRGRLLLAARSPSAAAEAARLAKRLVLERTPYADVWSLLLRAGAAASVGDAAAADGLLREAGSRAAASHMPLIAAAARLRASDGAVGASEVAAARRAIEALGVARPDRMVAVLAPGFHRD